MLKAMTLPIVVVLLAACQGAARPPVDEPATKPPAVVGLSSDEQPHVEVGDAAPQPDAGASSDGSTDAAPAEHQGDHMKHMNTVRDMLKWRLGASYDAPLPAVSPADVVTGKQLYAKHCAKCHGQTGRGDGPAAKDLGSSPSDHTDLEHARYYSENGRLWIVRHGIPGTTMPGFLNELGERGTLQVYAYTRSLAGGASGKPHRHPHGSEGSDHTHKH